MQKLCFHLVEAALLPKTLASGVVFVSWLIMLGRGDSLSTQELSLGRSRAIAKHTGFRGFLWVGSSCWEELTLFHCKSCAFIRSKPRYCQTHCFRGLFCGLAHQVGKR